MGAYVTKEKNNYQCVGKINLLQEQLCILIKLNGFLPHNFSHISAEAFCLIENFLLSNQFDYIKTGVQ